MCNVGLGRGSSFILSTIKVSRLEQIRCIQVLKEIVHHAAVGREGQLERRLKK